MFIIISTCIRKLNLGLSVKELSRFWQKQFLKEARRGKVTSSSSSTTENISEESDLRKKPLTPSPQAQENNGHKVSWLPELISVQNHRRHSASSEELLEKDTQPQATGNGISTNEENIVALDMSANIVIQSAKDDMDDDSQISDPEGHLLNPPGEGPGAFPCSSCGKVYRWKRTLRNHLRSECGKEPQFQCPFCHLRSKRKSNIYAHIRVVHQKPL